MSRLTWSRRALNNLQRMAEFVRAVNPANEAIVVDTVVQKADQQRRYPRSGQKQEAVANGAEIRSLRVSKYHRVVYAVQSNDNVTILQVLDTRSDGK